MTLLIAYLMMWHMGIQDGWAWVAVFVLWVLHVLTANSSPSSSQIRKIIREEIR